MKKSILNNLTELEIEDLMINEFGQNGDVSRISSSDIDEEGLTVSKIYRLEDCFVVVTENFDNFEIKVNYANQLDDAQKLATCNLLTV